MERMKDGAILSNTGHFNVEIEIGALRDLAVETREARALVDEFTMADGRRIYLIGEGRLVNLAAAEGHPALVMDMSFANQALSAEWVIQNAATLERKVYDVPKDIDDEIARLKLATMGITIDQLTEEQARYLASWDEGTYRAADGSAAASAPPPSRRDRRRAGSRRRRWLGRARPWHGRGNGGRSCAADGCASCRHRATRGDQDQGDDSAFGQVTSKAPIRPDWKHLAEIRRIVGSRLRDGAEHDVSAHRDGVRRALAEARQDDLRCGQPAEARLPAVQRERFAARPSRRRSRPTARYAYVSNYSMYGQGFGPEGARRLHAVLRIRPQLRLSHRHETR